MKFNLTFKTPDVMDELVSDTELTAEDREKAAAFASQWVTYREYVTIEFDTKTKTATVRRAT